MNEQILKVIKETLPEATAGVFKEFVDEANAREINLNRLRDDYDKLLSETVQLRSNETKYKELEQREDTLEKAEMQHTLHELSLNAQKDMIAMKESLMFDRVEDHKEMFRIVFQNRVTRENALVPMKNTSYDSEGRIISEYNASENVEKTVEEKT